MKKKISTLILLLSLGLVNAQIIETPPEKYEVPPPPPPPPGTPTGMTIFMEVQEEADFPGGFDALATFFTANIPETIPELNDLGIEGNVKVRFCVEQDGSITNVSVVQPLWGCKSCDKVVMDVVKKMPNWIPAKNNDHPVRSWVMIPIHFEANQVKPPKLRWWQFRLRRRQ